MSLFFQKPEFVLAKGAAVLSEAAPFASTLVLPAAIHGNDLGSQVGMVCCYI